jgi:superoxide oxidase
MNRIPYSNGRIALHWSMAALIVIGYILGDQLEELKDAARLDVMQWHALVGLTILLLLVPRAILRRGAADQPVTGGGAERLARSLVHRTLYLLLLVLPLTGLGILATGRGLLMFETFTLGGWMRSREVHVAFEQAHALLTDLLLGLFALHVVAVIWHQFVRQDEVLSRMLPRFKRR